MTDDDDDLGHKAPKGGVIGDKLPAGLTGGLPEITGPKVYVGNLPYDVTWKDLKEHMKTAGPVKHADVVLGDDGRSKGYGLVEFQSSLGAQQAVAILNNTELGGRQIFVREDREA